MPPAQEPIAAVAPAAATLPAAPDRRDRIGQRRAYEMPWVTNEDRNHRAPPPASFASTAVPPPSQALAPPVQSANSVADRRERIGQRGAFEMPWAASEEATYRAPPVSLSEATIEPMATTSAPQAQMPVPPPSQAVAPPVQGSNPDSDRRDRIGRRGAYEMPWAAAEDRTYREPPRAKANIPLVPRETLPTAVPISPPEPEPQGVSPASFERLLPGDHFEANAAGTIR
jgi:hypothetical protein